MTAFGWDDLVQIETEPPRWLDFGEIKARLPVGALDQYAEEHLERARVDGGLVCPKCKAGTHANGTHGLDVYGVKRDKWHCLSCGEGGDIFDLAGAVNGTEDKLEQKRIVCEWAGIDPHGQQGRPEGSGDGTAKSGTEAKPAAAKAAKSKHSAPEGQNRDRAADLTGEQQAELERYREQERQNIRAAQLAIEPGTPGYEYALKRGFTSEEIAARGLGYDPLKRRLVIPWSTDPAEFRHTDRDVTGTAEGRYKFLWCGGRVPDDRIIPKQLRKQLRLNGKPALFNPSALEHPLVWAVEGLMDAMSIEAVGGHAIAFDGTAHREGVKAIASKKYAGTIICALDNDQDEEGQSVKGREANADLVKMLVESGVKAVADRELMPDGLPGGAKDANEVLQTDRGTLQAYVAKAENEARERGAEAAYRNACKSLRMIDPADTIREISELTDWQEPTPTGLPQLDEALDGGLYRGMYTLGAISSFGKTTLALQIADTIAANGRPVLFVTIEQGANELVRKTIARMMWEAADRKGREAGTREINRPSEREKWDAATRARFEAALVRYTDDVAPRIIHLEGMNQPSVGQIAAALDAMADRHGQMPMVFIDYLQLLAPVNDRDTDKQAVDRNVMLLRQLAREKKTTVFSISSLNRQSYSDAVTLESFKESGAIEYGSDVLLGLQPYGLDRALDGIKEREARAAKARSMIEAVKRKPIRTLECKVLKQREGALADPAGLTYHAAANAFTDGVATGRIK